MELEPADVLTVVRRVEREWLSSPWIADSYGMRRRLTVVPSYRGPEICSQLTFSSGVSRNPLRFSQLDGLALYGALDKAIDT
jgi:hypothetical protein